MKNGSLLSKALLATAAIAGGALQGSTAGAFWGENTLRYVANSAKNLFNKDTLKYVFKGEWMQDIKVYLETREKLGQRISESAERIRVRSAQRTINR